MLVNDLLAYSLRLAGVLGVGQVALAQDTDDASVALQLMLEQWERKRWLVFRLVAVTVPATPGKQTYTIGPGAGADIFAGSTRPGTIEGGFLRQLVGSGPNSFPVDFPLRQINTLQEWSAIPLKNLGSWPGSFFYDPQVLNGVISIWPIPIQNFFELHFLIRQDTDEITGNYDLNEMFPPEVEEAIVYNLAGRLRIMYQLPLNPDVAALARATLNTLRTTNFAMRQLAMPAALRGSGRLRNPMGGFYETAAGIPFPVLR